MSFEKLKETFNMAQNVEDMNFNQVELNKKGLPKGKSGRPFGSITKNKPSALKNFEIFTAELEGMTLEQLKTTLAGPLVSVVLRSMGDEYMQSAKRAELAIKLFDVLHKYSAPLDDKDKPNYMDLIN